MFLKYAQTLTRPKNRVTITDSGDRDISLATKVVWAIEQNHLALAVAGLQELSDSVFPKAWIKSTEYALKTGNWAVLSDAFLKKEFIGLDGYFLLIAPYQLVSKGNKVIKLSAILGQEKPVNGVSLERVSKQIWDIFGVMYQPIADFISFNCLCASGHFDSETSEAFILPERWIIPGSINAPVLSNITQHRQRFYRSVGRNIPRIFEPQTANLLLESLADEEIGAQRQSIEYMYHEAGHATGLGIKRKIQENLFLNDWYAAVEEWRTDGVEFELAARTLRGEEIGELVAANLCLRFGIDAQRATEDDSDAHATCSLLMLDGLLRSGAFCIQENQLALCNPSYKNLAFSVEIQRKEAVHLTSKEIAADSIDCYQSIKLKEKTREVFQKFVIEPCL